MTNLPAIRCEAEWWRKNGQVILVIVEYREYTYYEPSYTRYWKPMTIVYMW